MEDSIFTRIINGEIPCHKIYEDEKVFAMLDIEPLANGHVLLFPKQQVDLLWDLDSETYAYLFEKAKMISKKIQQEMNPIRVGMVVEGFGVPHAHLHLVPLYDKEVLRLHHGYPVQKSPEDLAKIAQKIAFEKIISKSWRKIPKKKNPTNWVR
ncbi:MAG: HIT family protein [bacterium]|nr:HIT family protein [bacterium]